MSFVIPTHTWEFVVAATLIILVPGPSVLFTVARAIAWGRLIAVATVLGNALGFYIISIAVALGLGPILQRSPVAYHAVQWFGGAYLVYLGYQAIKSSTTHAQEMSSVTEDRPTIAQTIRQGFIVGVLNPKSIVFFAAILPQFTDRDRGHLSSQLLFLGTIFILIAFLSDSCWGIIAGTFRQWLANDVKRLIRMRKTGGYVMAALGIFTILNSFR
jgi:threonine/homoserine/homoserine lactone efflux protein